MIHIIHEKEEKKLALQISQYIQTRGFKTTIDIVTEKNINQVEAAIIIFSNKSNTSEKIITQYDFIFQNDVTLVPFVISDLEMSVSMQHFLNTHDWINGYDISTKEAITDLSVLLNEIINGETKQPVLAVQKPKVENEDLQKRKQTRIIIGVVIFFSLILLYFIFGAKNNSLKPSSKSDNILVGRWKLEKYEDNMPRSVSDQADFISSVTALKQNFLLVFNENFTFEKYGFTQTETGSWQLDPQNMVLYMWPPGSDDYKDVLKIEKLTNDTLIMTIATQIDSLTLINTKFTLYKE
ncbi:MAG: lipocalin family protein [Bacteroidales bacterium]|nr:lipocalin family protein [Bacteroidales bacterium]